MPEEPHKIVAYVVTGAPPTLRDILFEESTLDYLGGEPSRPLEDRYSIFPRSISERGKRRGGPRLYSFRDALVLSAIRSLVEDACLSKAAASKMLAQNGHVLNAALLRGEDLHYTRRRVNILGFDYSGADPLRDCGARALITIRPNQVWLEMRPRFFKLFPEETVEFERKLAESREKQRRGRAGDD